MNRKENEKLIADTIKERKKEMQKEDIKNEIENFIIYHCGSKEKYKHIYDEYDYDAEWQDTVDGVYIYDDAYYIFKHKDGINSTIICRENHISSDLSEIEFYLWEYVEFEYSVS